MSSKIGILDSISEKNDSTTRARIAEVYKLVAASIMASVVGVFVGQELVSVIQQYFIGFIILEFALLFGLMFAKEKVPLNLILMFGFTFMTGLTMAPLIAMYLSTEAGVNILSTALLATGASVGGLSLYAMKTKKDFTVYGQILFVALIALVVVGIANIFIQSSFLHLAMAYVGAILFSMYLIVDTQRLVRGMYSSPIIMAVNIYLDILNLFLSILSILSSRK